MKEVRLLALDLDGTVRQGKDDALGRFVNGPEDVHVFPEAVEMMRRWKAGGGRIIGVSNQGGIALGLVSADVVREAMDETDRQTCGLFDRILYCPHHPDAAEPFQARCWCRKPSPGLLIRAVLYLTQIYQEWYPPHLALMVGDRHEDRQCAELAGFDFLDATTWRAQAEVPA